MSLKIRQISDLQKAVGFRQRSNSNSDTCLNPSEVDNWMWCQWLNWRCLCAEPQLTVRRGSDSALCRAASDTSSECSTDSTVVSALQKFQLTSLGKSVQSHAVPAHHSAKHPVCLPHLIRSIIRLQPSFFQTDFQFKQLVFVYWLPSVLWHCWFGVRKSIWPVKVMRCWRGYLSGARCKWFAYGPADATATLSPLASLKSWLV